MATQSVKDILDTEIPKPSFVLSPSVPAPLPSDVTLTRSGGDNAARTLDPYSGRFEQVGENTPRIYGSQQSLLVEAAGRTNRVLDSADPSSWGVTGPTLASATSILKGETAQTLTGSAGSDEIHSDAGTFSSGTEVVSFIIEKGTAPETGLRLRVTGGSDIVRVNYDWSADSFTTVGGSYVRADTRVLQSSGPNGGKLVRSILEVSGMTQGDSAQVEVFPDPNGNGDTTTLHHAQIEEAPNASSPIVTQGSAKTRAGDDVTIFSGGQPEWWNPNEGTIYIEFDYRGYDWSTGAPSVIGNSFGENLLFNNNKGTAPLFNWGTYDGNSIINPPQSGGVPAFETAKFAVSLTDQEIRNALDGKSAVGTHNGSLLQLSVLRLGHSGSWLGSAYTVRYTPQALPATPADRSAGDPISLETLTS